MYAQADLRLCWSHIPHCWKSHVVAQIYLVFSLKKVNILYIFHVNNLIADYLNVISSLIWFLKAVTKFEKVAGYKFFIAF